MNTDYDTAFGGGGLIPIDGEFYHPWLHKLAAKLNQGYAPTVIIVGETGSGKSYAGMKAIEWLYENDFIKAEFEPEHNLVYDVLPFLKYLVNEVPNSGEDDINPEREVFQFDEGGANFDSKDFQSVENRSMDDVLQTMRIKNCPWFFVTPDIENIDKQIRKEVDFIVSMKDRGVARVTGIKRVRDRLNGSWDYEFINYTRIGGPWVFDEPRDEWTEVYSEKEVAAKEGFIEDWIDDIEDNRSDGTGVDLSDI